MAMYYDNMQMEGLLFTFCLNHYFLKEIHNHLDPTGICQYSNENWIANSHAKVLFWAVRNI